MAAQRNLLLIALLVVSFLIWRAWVSDHAPKTEIPSQLTSHSIQKTEQISDINTVSGQNISVQSDVLSLMIDTAGGNINSALLLKYPETLGSKASLALLSENSNFIYFAESGLTGTDGLDNPSRPTPIYQTDKANYQLEEGQDSLSIPMTYKSNGITYIKTYTLTRGSYNIGVSYEVVNNSDSAIKVNPFGLLRQSANLPQNTVNEGGNGLGLTTYRGAAYSSSETNYSKYTFKSIQEDPKQLEIMTNVGWVAMLQHYFATAWIPTQNQQNTFFTKNYPNNQQVVIGYLGPETKIDQGQTEILNSNLWVGPEIQDQLEVAAKHLDLVVDYGWLWFISQPLFYLLKFIHNFIGNWGVSIIIITFIIRGILFPLTRAQYRSMAKMKLLQPRLQALKERFGDDRQSMSKETMALYRQEKVNPLGGCLPLVIQMPIFLSLFYMLSGSVELRQAPFCLWIQDLAAPDPYYILPLLMGLMMFLIQKMSPTPVTDPLQQKLMMFMPVIFTVFFLWFPSGLVLYYTVSNLFTLVQQRIIYWELEKKGLHENKKKIKN